jgi:ketosteroid isomerase-like protein
MNNPNVAAAERFFAAITAADSATMLALLDPQVEWLVPKTAAPPYGGRHRGAQKIVDMMLQSVKATFLPGTVIHNVLMWMSDDTRVIAETNMTARQANGREYNNFYVFIFEFRDGLITEIREHVDTAYAVQFFGAGS